MPSDARPGAIARATPARWSPRPAHLVAAIVAIASLAATGAPLSAQPLRRSPLLSLCRFPIADSVLPPPQCLIPSPQSLSPGAYPPSSDPSDPWFGRDKARHFGASAAIQLMGYGILHIAGLSRTQSMLGAALVTASAGIGKELWDRGGRGTPSRRDLVWDAAGLLTGSGLAQIADPP